MRLNDLVFFLNDFLVIDDISDGAFNGLQIEGKEEVKKIAFAVDAGVETFEEVIKQGADFIVVHHGIFWDGLDPSLASWKKKRVEMLLNKQISLYAAHLPLDRHPEVGNNAQILKLLGVEIKEEFHFYEGKNVGWIGHMVNGPWSMVNIEKELNDKLETTCKVLPFGKKMIKTVAVCSGGGGYRSFNEALNVDVDLLITGDQVDIYSTAKDAGINVIFAGHHATETVGLKALQKVVEEKFGIETIFIDIPTGL